MSDPLTNMGTNDVLSSIRRLVSEGPVSDETGPQTAVDDQPSHPLEKADRLVLTPSQRIESAAPVADDTSNSQPSASEEGQEAPFVVPMNAAVLPEIEAMARRLIGPNTPEMQDLILAEIQAVLPGTAKRAPDAKAAPFGDAETPVTASGLDDDVLEAEVEAREDVTPAATDDLPDQIVAEAALESSPAPKPEVLRLVDPSFVPPVISEQANTDEAQEPSPDVIEDEAVFTTSRGRTTALERKIAELEALIAASKTAPDPGETEDEGDNAAVSEPEAAMPWFDTERDAQDAAEAADHWAPDPEPEAEPAVDKDAPSETPVEAPMPFVSSRPDLQLVHSVEDPSQDLTITEDELRILVGKMIRDELQGVLGERITRNVRKLVRREVQRALMNHDLD